MVMASQTDRTAAKRILADSILGTKDLSKAKMHRSYESASRRVLSTLLNEIEIPAVVDPQRRGETEVSLRLFCEHYFPERFYLGWSESHLELIRVIEECVRTGGTFSFALPRGSGKTAIAEVGAIWALLHGHKKYVICLGATGLLGKRIFHSVRTELEVNQPLWEDFPEVCQPIRAGDFNPLKYRYQSYNGQPTRIQYSSDHMSLPHIDGSKAAGSFVQCGSIGGSLRGAKHTTSTGQNLRPDFVIVDDPQTDKSAKSKSQTEAREKIIQGAILGLAGPRQPITVIMPCTVIQTDDLADRFLNRDTKPEWQGVRSKLLNQFPDNMDLWVQYHDIRNHSFREGRRGVDATEFYAVNREKMDAGAVVTWIDRFNPPKELSAIQHAMNLYFRDPTSFASEYQNEPLTQSSGEQHPTIDLQSRDIVQRLSGLPLGTVPRNTICVTGGIDIQQDVLYWLTVAWTSDFGGVICDYGTFPDQTTEYFDSHHIQRKLSHAFPGLTGIAPLCYQGLKTLQRTAFAKLYMRDETELSLPVDVVCIDANWNRTTDAVYQFCKEYSAQYFPCQGVGIGAAGNPMSSWQRRAGDQPNKANWRIRASTLSAARGRYICFDTNFWKSRVAERLIAPMGSGNALMLHGKSTMRHQLLADHLSSEVPIRTHGRGRDVDEWRTRASTSENHWWDCYDDETEVLTRDGFKYFRDVNGSEELATVNLDTDELEYHKPLHVIHKSYSGGMLKIGGELNSRVNLVITPNHRMVVYPGQKSDKACIKLAKELTIWDRLKPNCKWVGESYKSYSLPAVGKNLAVKLDAVTAAKFLGWVVSEGYVKQGRQKNGYYHRVIIAQSYSANPRKWKEIQLLLRQLPWKFHYSDTGFMLTNRQAYLFALQCGQGAGNKKVPQWVKDSSPEIINAFIETAVKGDGWRCGNHEAYATVSRKLSDDFQELYLKCGYGVSVVEREAKVYVIRGREGSNTRKQYHVHRKQTKYVRLRDGDNKPNFKVIYYNGMVHCATVPNGTLIVRRRGKVIMCGNCSILAAIAASKQGLELLEITNGGSVMTDDPENAQAIPLPNRERKVAAAPPRKRN